MILRSVLYASLVVLFALHNDLWLWHDASNWLGLPAGFAYHVLYCLAVSGLMFLLVRDAWPSLLDEN
jgi:hypothetical protein